MPKRVIRAWKNAPSNIKWAVKQFVESKKPPVSEYTKTMDSYYKETRTDNARRLYEQK